MLTAAQICSMARGIARTPGLTTVNGATVSSGDILNLVLSDLCQTYDFALGLGSATVLLTPLLGSGPYPLPTDYLRMAQNEVVYFVQGVPYVMVNIALWEFDALVQQAGISNFPEQFATDPSTSPPSLFVWPPSGGSYTLDIRYQRQMPDMGAPETSAAIPWFVNQNYLITRVAGEIMKISNDPRWQAYLGKTPDGAQGILERYLLLQADDEGRAQTVQLDRRRFGTNNFNRLPNTKTLGW